MTLKQTIQSRFTAENSREFVPDLMRCLAVLTAIATHSLQQDISQGIISAPGPVYRCTLLYIVFLVCNPIYVMLSGSLLLKWREEKLSRFYLRRVLRVAVPMAIYYLWYVYVNHARGTAVDAAYIRDHIVRNLLTGSTGESPHYWLMYIILSLYIVFPFFRFMFRDMPYRTLTAFAGVILTMMAVSTFFPALGLPLAVNSFLSGWYGIAILGYWITQKETRRYDRVLIAIGAALLPVMAVVVLYRPDAVALLANVSPIAAVFAMSLFSLCYVLCAGRTNGPTAPGTDAVNGPAMLFAAAVRIVSRHSFGILLIHWYVLHRIVRERLHLTGGFGNIGAAWGTILAVFATCAISLVIAVLMDATVLRPFMGGRKSRKTLTGK